MTMPSIFLGIDEDGTKPKNYRLFSCGTGKTFNNSVQMQKESMARAICLYFRKWNPERAKDNPVVKEYWEELNEGGNIVFSMRGMLCTGR